MCPNCRAFVTTSDKVCPYCDAKIGPRAIEMRSPSDALGGLIPHARFTTVMILLINFGLFVACYLNPDFIKSGESLPWPYLQNEWWRLITAGFLHANIIHILMNSWVLFDLGTEVEQIYGTPRMLVFYFFSTVTGFLISSRYGFNPSVGSSAGIFGLVGAMLAFGVFDQSALGRTVKALYMRWIVYLLVMSFIPGVDFRAHIGGLSGGFIAGWIASTPRARLMWKEPLLRGLAALSILLTALAFVMMFKALTSNPA